ncbi:MAG: iron-containing alcohol dehydrogenase, partial [Eubacteriaceae bacterium]|nr:iron-containing alcohol dehydrogenase [Eubacteriaceae bacterium]
HNIKKTFSAVCPEVIIGDTDLLATAPDIMIAAGFGDIIGKYLAINDWKISRIINAEYYCPDVADLVLETVQKCVNAVPGLAKRDPQALQYLMESLVLSGIAISFVGYSRPASGSEHHISHFLEMSAVFDGQYGQLHGSCVGMATCLISSMYQQLLEKPWDYARARRHAESFDYTAWESETNRVFGKASDAVITLYGKTHQNDPLNVLARIDQIEKNEEAIRHLIQNVVDQTARTPEYLKTLGGLTDPNAFIAGGERFRDILLHAKDLRDRYAALQMFYDLDELDGLVDSIIQQYYQ